MKSLVDIAKEMDFEPNPNLTKEDWGYLVDALKTYMLQIDTGLPLNNKLEQKRHLSVANIPDLIYHTNSIMKRSGSDEAVAQNIALLKKQSKKIIAIPQNFPEPWNETSYIHRHSITNEDLPYRERFIFDIDMASPQFPNMLKKLDEFIIKHNSHYKMVNDWSRHRSDTMNLYMAENITPEIAKELFNIVKPCLDTTNHQKLNGLDIYVGDTPVYGMKIGPVLNKSRDAYDEREAKKDQWILRDIGNSDLREIADGYLKDWVGREPYMNRELGKEKTQSQPSLGSVVVSIELMNLMYYMIGKEGQNPFRLLGYDNNPYQKHISFTAEVGKEKPRMADSIWKKIKSLFRKSDKTPKMQTSTFNWKNSGLWSDVQVEHDGRVYFGHRIKISSLSDADREALKAGLKEQGINYTERPATTHSGDILPGDLTIRITEPESIQKLRSFVFEWAEGPHARPISKSTEEYQAERKLIREKRLAKISSSSDKPKWADKRYWEKVSDGEKGYVMDLGTAARYNDLGQPEGAPFNEEIIIKELAKKGIQAEKRVSGFSNCLPAYKMTHDSLVILGEKNAEKFEKMYLQEGQNLSHYAVRGQGGER